MYDCIRVRKFLNPWIHIVVIVTRCKNGPALWMDPACPSITLITPVGSPLPNPPGRTIQYLTIHMHINIQNAVLIPLSVQLMWHKLHLKHTCIHKYCTLKAIYIYIHIIIDMHTTYVQTYIYSYTIHTHYSYLLACKHTYIHTYTYILNSL